MKKNERLLDVLGQVDDEFIEASASAEKRTGVYRKLIPFAACLAVAVVLSIGLMQGGALRQTPKEELGDTRWPVKIVTGDETPQSGGEMTQTDGEVGGEATQSDDVTQNGGETTQTGTETAVTGTETTQVTADTTRSGGTEDTTPDNGEELGRIPKWDEMTVLMKFPGFDNENGSYTSRGAVSDADKVGEAFGTAVMKGYDIYTDQTYTTEVQLAPIDGVSEKCAVAVKFGGVDGYFAYVNRDYVPVTLGDMIDDLNLREYMDFGSVWYRYNGDNVEFTVDDGIIWDMLLADTSLANIDDNDRMMLVNEMSASVNIPMLGYKNIGIWVTDDGYLATNILETRKVFFIGKEKADAFVNYVVENCEGSIIRYEGDAGEEGVME